MDEETCFICLKPPGAWTGPLRFSEDGAWIHGYCLDNYPETLLATVKREPALKLVKGGRYGEED